jgi:hypothetical protein
MVGKNALTGLLLDFLHPLQRVVELFKNVSHFGSIRLLGFDASLQRK